MFKDATLESSMVADSMFTDSMLETSWAQRTRRNWTTMTSFGLQAVIIGLLLLLPLLRTVGLPAARTVSTPISRGRNAPEPLAPAPRRGVFTATQTTTLSSVLMQPQRMPAVINIGADEPVPEPPGGPGGGIPGTGIPPGAGNGLISNIIGTHPIPPSPPPTITHAIRTSSMLEGNLIRRVEPVYPPLARSARIQGPVVLSALISKAGTIEDLRALSGPPMLVRAAIDAVSQWRYRPYILNNEPIEVETQITVNFYLAGN